MAKRRIRKAVKQIGGAALEAAESVAAEKMLAELRRVIERVNSAPAHIVAAAGIVNGMPADEINARVLKAMDDAGL